MPGKYIGRKMLQALVDTLGQEYVDLLRGSSRCTGDNNHLLDCLTLQISESQAPGEETDESDDETDDDYGYDYGYED